MKLFCFRGKILPHFGRDFPGSDFNTLVQKAFPQFGLNSEATFLRPLAVPFAQFMRIVSHRLRRFIPGLLLLASALSMQSAVVINEIWYHPVSTNVLEEWFE